MKTTLNRIRQLNCLPFESFEKLLRCVGVTAPNDAPLHMVLVLDALDLGDAVRCLPAVDGFDREIRLYAVSCVDHVRHCLNDPRNRRMLDVAAKYARGQASGAELNAAWDESSAAGDNEAGRAAWACGMFGIKTAIHDVVAAVQHAAHLDPKESITRSQVWFRMRADFQDLIMLEVEHHKIGIIPRP